MGVINKIAEATETTKTAMTIWAIKVVLMELVINATSLYISKKISIRNREMNTQILMKIVATATSWT